MRTLLLYNPVSGRNHANRPQTIRALCDLLTLNGHQPTAIATTSSGSAADQARTAANSGTQLILACGGDGTIHDVLQGLVGTSPQPILGIIPMGSANALARHLRLSMDPIAAARQLLTFEPHSIPVGQIATTQRSRYFLAMAGGGPDGALVYGMLPGAKHRLGRLSYYLRAATLVASRRFPAFDLVWTSPADPPAAIATHSTRAVAAMALRIDDLGGLFAGLAPAGAVHHEHLALIAVRPPAWIGLAAWFASGRLRLHHRNPLVVSADASTVTITPDANTRIHLQADGEWVGTAPATLRLIPHALRLLMRPSHAEANSHSDEARVGSAPRRPYPSSTP